jgi:hypothetical protein
MQTKLSLLSRAASVAAFVALALPALAQTSQTTAPTTPSITAPGNVKPGADGVAPKTEKKKHVAKKDTKTAQQKQTAEKAAKKLPPASPASSDGAK